MSHFVDSHGAARRLTLLMRLHRFIAAMVGAAMLVVMVGCKKEETMNADLCMRMVKQAEVKAAWAKLPDRKYPKAKPVRLVSIVRQEGFCFAVTKQGGIVQFGCDATAPAEAVTP
jgi:hypothetical protein